MEHVDPRDRRIAELERQLAEVLDLVGTWQARVSELEEAVRERDEIIARQAEVIEKQAAIIEAQAKRIAELEKKLGIDSSNSSMPPSSDPPWKKRKKRKPRRKPGKRKAGGQKGHKGTTRDLLPVEEVDEVVTVSPTACAGCGKPLSEHARSVGEPARHQVTEIPEPRPRTTEFQRLRLRCDGCGHATLAELPAGVPRTSLGPRAQATVAGLSGRYRLSRREVSEVASELLGLPVSIGTVQACCERTSDALREPVEEGEAAARASGLVHADETGWKQWGVRHWLWVVTTAICTFFRVANSRGGDVIKGMLGPDWQGILVVDRWAGYGAMSKATRQFCWAHLERDFQRLVDMGGKSKPFGEWALRETKCLFRLWHEHLDGDLEWDDFRASVALVKARFKRLLLRGRDQLDPKRGHGLCKNLLKHWEPLWTFTRVQGVEPTNNTAERAIRPAVLWRKSCQGTRSDAGSVFVQRMLTTAATCRQHRRPLLPYLTEVCRAANAGETPPSLIPQTPAALPAAS